jgi:phospholipid/cholesterol/gamma-HCH transport system substrate-binding protein
MENKAHALQPASFVLVVSALLVALAAWLTRDTGEHRVYEISSPEASTACSRRPRCVTAAWPWARSPPSASTPKAMGNVLVRLAVDDSAPVTRRPPLPASASRA